MCSFLRYVVELTQKSLLQMHPEGRPDSREFFHFTFPPFLCSMNTFPSLSRTSGYFPPPDGVLRATECVESKSHSALLEVMHSFVATLNFCEVHIEVSFEVCTIANAPLSLNTALNAPFADVRNWPGVRHWPDMRRSLVPTRGSY